MLTKTEMQSILDQINSIVEGLDKRIKKLEEAAKPSTTKTTTRQAAKPSNSEKVTKSS